ncbi:hypothetical protein WA026_003126 [Henosepilachna vigintioctopunctata]|uniref:Uncharacterized protein n=1 Tax=Henosepilachna vigintioctopunctata TaxID=420089 RepID=A0AAW1TQG0_9CUCU
MAALKYCAQIPLEDDTLCVPFCLPRGCGSYGEKTSGFIIIANGKHDLAQFVSAVRCRVYEDFTKRTPRQQQLKSCCLHAFSVADDAQPRSEPISGRDDKCAFLAGEQHALYIHANGGFDPSPTCRLINSLTFRIASNG